ncbi:DUF2087 domain-containing protein [Paenibacillus sp. NPDC056933]|uniref:DUF2087 domain-containing protein n=1 Tax=Paenibacillus sp. NPDC056933 TaxID=3345968 RepID=UPI003637CE2B
MKSSESLLQTASLEEIKCGYVKEEPAFICICCGYRTELGIIYPEEGVLYEAERYMRVHIEKTHGSVFEYLLELDKSITGLSDVQRGLLGQFYEGKKDTEVQKALGIGSASTIRNHRFVLKEKERQAKIFLALMELLKSKDTHAPAELVLPVTRHVKTINRNQFEITEQDREKVLRKYFPEGTEGPLTTFHIQQKHKWIVLTEIAKRFEPGQQYTEKQVNELLKQTYGDYVELRRYMIDFGLLVRKEDGSRYWLANDADHNGKGKKHGHKGSETETEAVKREDKEMNRRKELQEQAKEIKTEAGVYQIRNERNGKVFLDSTLNLKTINGQKFMLQMGSHLNRQLQAEWNEYGDDAFVIEVLEKLKKEDSPYFDTKDALAKLVDRWFDQLEPYGDKGYHGDKKESGQ